MVCVGQFTTQTPQPLHFSVSTTIAPRNAIIYNVLKLFFHFKKIKTVVYPFNDEIPSYDDSYDEYYYQENEYLGGLILFFPPLFYLLYHNSPFSILILASTATT
jgi:hypothetical protein